jgi:hypothetical protein
MPKVSILAKASASSDALLLSALLLLVVSSGPASVSAIGVSERLDTMKERFSDSPESDDNSRMEPSTPELPSSICIGICSPVQPVPTSPSRTDLIHVTWSQDAETFFTSGIFLKRDGADFDPSTIRVDAGSGIRDTAIAVSGSTVHIAWAPQTCCADIRYARSTDGGATFSQINLDDKEGVAKRSPAIAISHNNVYIVWEESTPNHNILYVRSTDGGATFGPIMTLSNNEGFSSSPAIAAYENNVYVAWSESSTVSDHTEILYRTSSDGGVAFGSTINLSNSEGDSIQPTISVDRRNVYVAWADGTPTEDSLFKIFYRKSTNGGLTFGDTTNLSGSTGSAVEPKLDASQNSVYIVWSSGVTSPGEIFYRKSTNIGTTFGDINNLSNNVGNSQAPAIAVSNNNVYVVWSDDSSGSLEILYRTSADRGTTFNPIFTNLSTDDGDTFSPDIAVSSLR